MAGIAVFHYKNHRGEVAERRVRVDSIDFIREPGFGYEAGWFVSGLCLDKRERRSFSFANIIVPEGAKHYSPLRF